MAQANRKTKMARVRTLLTNYIVKNGELPERQAALKLLHRRIELSKAQASTYFNNFRKEEIAKAA